MFIFLLLDFKKCIVSLREVYFSAASSSLLASCFVNGSGHLLLSLQCRLQSPHPPNLPILISFISSSHCAAVPDSQFYMIMFANDAFAVVLNRLHLGALMCERRRLCNSVAVAPKAALEGSLCVHKRGAGNY